MMKHVNWWIIFALLGCVWSSSSGLAQTVPAGLLQEDYQTARTRARTGTDDVFIGHSMRGGVGAWSVREAGFRPKLFVGIGAPVELGERGLSVLLLAGLFEEFFRPAQLHARTHAQVVISPWSDHILEFCDSVLVRAAVKTACAAVGKPVPAAPTAWRWRFPGAILPSYGIGQTMRFFY